jgi:hypothetical protein
MAAVVVGVIRVVARAEEGSPEEPMVPKGDTVAVEGERLMTPAAGMNECGMTKAATTTMTAAHMAAKSAAKSATVSATATAAAAVSAAMGQRRHRRAGHESRRRGQRYHRLAHRHVSSVCCDQRQRLRPALSHVELVFNVRSRLSPRARPRWALGPEYSND